MSISEKFKKFCMNIRISKENVDTIAYRYRRITKQLNKDFWNSESEVNNSLYVGSYGRDTEIHTSDIDMLFILPYSVYKRYNEYLGNGQSALLQEVKNSIQKTYNSYIRGDGQVVKVEFTDNISFEIVPCFLNSDDISYTYPDTKNGGSWKVTNPKKEIEAVREGNRIWNRNLKNLCRMVRAWKEKNNVPIGGLLIDTLAYNFLKDWKYNNESFIYYDWITRDFLKYLSDQDKDKKYWFALGSNQLVYRTGNFEYKALVSYNLSLEAIEFEKDKYEYSANQNWVKIYGSIFLY